MQPRSDPLARSEQAALRLLRELIREQQRARSTSKPPKPAPKGRA